MNCTTLIGRLTKDPELRQASGSASCRFTLAVDGRIQTGAYVNHQGVKVYTTDVIADRIDFLDSRSEGTIQRYGQGTTYSGTYGWGGSR